MSFQSETVEELPDSSTLTSKKSVVAKSAIWYSLATFLTKGLAFVTIPIFTRIMTAGEFGSFNNFAAWQIILLSVFGLESYLTINRARFDYSKQELQEYQFSLLTAGMLVSLLLGVILVVAPGVAEGFTELDAQYLIVLVLYVLFYPSFAMFQSLQRVQYKYKLSALLSFGTSFVATVLSVVLVLTLSDALMGRIIGQYAPFIILGVVFYGWYAKSGCRIRFSYIRYAMPLCIPLITATLGSQVLLLACRIVAQHMCGSDDVAFVSLATTCAQVALILVTTLNNAWSPWFLDCLHEKQYEEARKVFKLFAWGVLLVTLGVSFAAPELVFILGGTEYQPTTQLVPSFMSACLLSMISSQYVFIETFHKNVRVGGLATLAVGGVNIGLCILFINLGGAGALGYANVLSYALLLVCHKFAIRNFESPDLFDWRTIGMPMVLSAASMPLCLWLYGGDWAVVRFAFFLACFIAGLFVLKRAKTAFSTA